METREDGNLRIVKVGPLGGFANNAYVIADNHTKDAVLIDMPSDSAQALAVIKDSGYHTRAVLLTHSHPDHWMDYQVVKKALEAPVMAHEAERGVLGNRIDEPVADNQEIAVGQYIIKAMHTPGHTPGSICFVVNRYLFSGDALFPGGPGRTRTPADLQEAVASVKSRLLALPDDTEVFPGHGDNGIIGQSRREVAAFESRQHPPDLCGDVTWES